MALLSTPQLSTYLAEKATSDTVVAPVQEVFSSLQGEGPFVGQRQLFIRFAHCHLKCAYCDTAMMTKDGLCHIENKPGDASSIGKLENPVSTEVLLKAMAPLIKQYNHKTLSFTGGEPLLYHRFLAKLFKQVKQTYGDKPGLYLETSGTQPEFLETVLPWTDIVAMDFKLPSTTKEKAEYQAHSEFYKMARQNLKAYTFVKLIFDETTTNEEWDAVKAAIDDPNAPIFLQPVTDLITKTIKVPSRSILKAEETLSRFFTDVRVVPQTHKMIQVR